MLRLPIAMKSTSRRGRWPLLCVTLLAFGCGPTDERERGGEADRAGEPPARETTGRVPDPEFEAICGALELERAERERTGRDRSPAGFYRRYRDARRLVSEGLSTERRTWFREQLNMDNPTEGARQLRTAASEAGVEPCGFADAIDAAVRGETTPVYAAMTADLVRSFGQDWDTPAARDMAAQTGRSVEELRVLSLASGCGDIPACAGACFEVLGVAQTTTPEIYAEIMAGYRGPCDAPADFEALEGFVTTRLVEAAAAARPLLPPGRRDELDRGVDALRAQP